MSVQLPITEFTPEQRELWGRVAELWACAKGRDERQIRLALHPHYGGWDMSAPLLHDRDAAVRSMSDDAPERRTYELHPLSVQVYDGEVGVVHHSYSAMVVPTSGQPLNVTGRWSEAYLRKGGAGTMISVSGRPDPPAAAAG